MPTEQIVAFFTVGAGGTAIGAFFTFIIGNRNSISQASETAVKNLTTTIEQLQDIITMLTTRVVHLETEISSLRAQNMALMEELHKARIAWAAAEDADDHS